MTTQIIISINILSHARQSSPYRVPLFIEYCGKLYRYIHVTIIIISLKSCSDFTIASLLPFAVTQSHIVHYVEKRKKNPQKKISITDRHTFGADRIIIGFAIDQRWYKHRYATGGF